MPRSERGVPVMLRRLLKFKSMVSCGRERPAGSEGRNELGDRSEMADEPGIQPPWSGPRVFTCNWGAIDDQLLTPGL